MAYSLSKGYLSLWGVSFRGRDFVVSEDVLARNEKNNMLTGWCVLNSTPSVWKGHLDGVSFKFQRMPLRNAGCFLKT